MLDAALAALSGAWGCTVQVQRRRPLVSVEDNYDRLGYAAGEIIRDARYSRYAAETVMLRSHTSAGVPPALRALTEPDVEDIDVLLALPGLCYRRDRIDRLHVAAPHQLDLWRIRTTAPAGTPLGEADLTEMITQVAGAVLPGARWRSSPVQHPYTRSGRQVDVETASGWVELAECGLAADPVLAGAGLNPTRCSGLALGMGLDRAVMLRKGIDDIRLLRSSDPRVATQMLDLARWRTVSAQPPVRRDLSIVVDAPADAELLGDAVRTALGPNAEDLESVTILASTDYPQ